MQIPVEFGAAQRRQMNVIYLNGDIEDVAGSMLIRKKMKLNITAMLLGEATENYQRPVGGGLHLPRRFSRVHQHPLPLIINSRR